MLYYKSIKMSFIQKYYLKRGLQGNDVGYIYNILTWYYIKLHLQSTFRNLIEEKNFKRVKCIHTNNFE